MGLIAGRLAIIDRLGVRLGGTLAAVGLVCLGACSLNSLGLGDDEPEHVPKLAKFQRDSNQEREAIAGIDVAAGIGYADASRIANYYLPRQGRDSAILMSLRESDRYWLGQLMSKSSGLPLGAPLRIDKQTGGVSWALGPTVRNLQELLEK